MIRCLLTHLRVWVKHADVWSAAGIVVEVRNIGHPLADLEVRVGHHGRWPVFRITAPELGDFSRSYGAVKSSGVRATGGDLGRCQPWWQGPHGDRRVAHSVGMRPAGFSKLAKPHRRPEGGVLQDMER